MSNLKPFLVGGIIVAADKMILNQQDMNSSLYYGVLHKTYHKCCLVIKDKLALCLM